MKYWDQSKRVPTVVFLFFLGASKFTSRSIRRQWSGASTYIFSLRSVS
jgi:hypothetical protein